MLAPVLVTPATVKPLTLDEAKAHLNVDHSDDDPLISAMIDAAVSHIEGWSGSFGKAIINQTWKVEDEDFDCKIRLPIGNLQSVTSVKYYDTANVQQTLSSTVYGAYTDGIGPFVALKSNQSWPPLYVREDAVEVTWVAGYGAAASNVPPAIVHAIRLMVGHWYANRETTSGVDMKEIPFAATSLLAGFRRQHI